MEGIPALQMWDSVLETFPHSSAGGNLDRQCGEAHCHFHSDNHMSVDMVDHVPPNFPDRSLPAKFFRFRGQWSGHSHDH